ncbi:hypothetical protein ACHAXS_013487 [Conticribra weissflogii]
MNCSDDEHHQPRKRSTVPLQHQLLNPDLDDSDISSESSGNGFYGWGRARSRGGGGGDRNRRGDGDPDRRGRGSSVGSRGSSRAGGAAGQGTGESPAATAGGRVQQQPSQKSDQGQQQPISTSRPRPWQQQSEQNQQNQFGKSIYDSQIEELQRQLQNQPQSQTYPRPQSPPRSQLNTNSNSLLMSSSQKSNSQTSLSSHGSQKHDQTEPRSHSPTPFRHMMPKEFALSSSVKREHTAMPFPQLSFRNSSRGRSGSAGGSLSRGSLGSVAGNSVSSGGSGGDGQGSLNNSIDRTGWPNRYQQQYAIYGQDVQSQHQKQWNQEQQQESDKVGSTSQSAQIPSYLSGEITVETKYSGEDSGHHSSHESAKVSESDDMEEFSDMESEVGIDGNTNPTTRIQHEHLDNMSRISEEASSRLSLNSSVQSSQLTQRSGDQKQNTTRDTGAGNSTNPFDSNGTQMETDNRKQSANYFESNETSSGDTSKQDSGSNYMDKSEKTITVANVTKPTTLSQTPTKAPLVIDDTDDGEENSQIPKNILNTPHSVSTLSPSERPGIGSRATGARTGNVSAFDLDKSKSEGLADTVASARFGRLLQECRILTEGCGSSVVSSSDAGTPNSSEDVSSSKNASLSSNPISGVEGGSSKAVPFGERDDRVVPKFDLRKKAAAFTAVTNADMDSTKYLQREIDTSQREYNLSAITMDPSLRVSLDINSSSLKPLASGFHGSKTVSDFSIGVDDDDEIVSSDKHEKSRIETLLENQEEEVEKDIVLDPNRTGDIKGEAKANTAPNFNDESNISNIASNQSKVSSSLNNLSQKPSKDSSESRSQHSSSSEKVGGNSNPTKSSPKKLSPSPSNESRGSSGDNIVPLRSSDDKNIRRPSFFGRIASQFRPGIKETNNVAASESSFRTSDIGSVEDDDGLLVGFGKRHDANEESSSSSGSFDSEYSDSNSSSTSSSSGSSSYSSGSSSGSGSEGSSSSSEESESDESSSDLPTVARNGIHFDCRDSVSELSFGGASALAAKAAKLRNKSLIEKEKERADSSPSESDATPSPPDKKSTLKESDLRNSTSSNSTSSSDSAMKSVPMPIRAKIAEPPLEKLEEEDELQSTSSGKDDIFDQIYCDEKTAPKVSNASSPSRKFQSNDSSPKQDLPSTVKNSAVTSEKLSPSSAHKTSNAASVGSKDSSNKSSASNMSTSSRRTPASRYASVSGNESYYSGVVARAATLLSQKSGDGPTKFDVAQSGSNPLGSKNSNYGAAIAKSIRDEDARSQLSSRSPRSSKSAKSSRNSKSSNSSSISKKSKTPKKKKAKNQARMTSSSSSSSVTLSFLSPIKEGRRFDELRTPTSDENDDGGALSSSSSLASHSSQGTNSVYDNTKHDIGMGPSSEDNSLLNMNTEAKIGNASSAHRFDQNESKDRMDNNVRKWQEEDASFNESHAKENLTHEDDAESLSSMSSVASNARRSFFEQVASDRLLGYSRRGSYEVADLDSGIHDGDVAPIIHNVQTLYQPRQDDRKDNQNNEHKQLEGNAKSDSSSVLRRESVSSNGSRSRKLITGISNQLGSSADANANVDAVSSEAASQLKSSASKRNPRRCGNLASDNRSQLSKDDSSALSGQDEVFDGEDLYEGFPSQKARDEKKQKRKDQGGSVTSAEIETNSRRPWRKMRSSSEASKNEKSFLSVSEVTGTDSPQKEPDDIQRRESHDGSESSTLSELLDSKKALQSMGLYATDDNLMDENDSDSDRDVEEGQTEEQDLNFRKHLHRSSTSSSITEWDYSGQTTVFKKTPSIAEKSVSSSSSKDPITTKEELRDESEKMERTSDGDNLRSSARMLASTAKEMTDLLQKSFRTRGKPLIDDLESSSSDSSSVADKSEEIEGELHSLLPSFQRKSTIAELSDSDSSTREESFNKFPQPNDHDNSDSSDSSVVDIVLTSFKRKSSGSNSARIALEREVNDEPPSPKSNFSDESGDSALHIDSMLKSFRKKPTKKKDSSPVSESSVGSDGSTAKLNSMLQSFRKKSSKKTDLPSFSDEEDGSHPLPGVDNTSFLIGYRQAALCSPSKGIDDESSVDSSKKKRTKLSNSNPFLDEESSIFSGDGTKGDCGEKGGTPVSLDDESAKKSRYAFLKSKYFCIGTAVVLVVTGVVVGVILGTKGSAVVLTPTAQPTTSVFQPTERPTSPPTMPATSRIWVQVGGDLVGESPNDEAGFSVSASEDGNRVVIGARRNANNDLRNRGSARIFEFDSLTGFYVPIWDMYGESAGDQCGFSVSMTMDGKRVAVGCLGSDKNGDNSGQAQIFDENEASGTWVLVAEFLGEMEGSLFGTSVSLSQDGSSLAVGAPYYNQADELTRSGRVYVYKEFQDTVWEPFGDPMNGQATNDLFGWSVSLSPNARHLAIGAPNREGSESAGYVKIFTVENGNWKLNGEAISIGIAGDRFGFSICLGGTNKQQRIVIGAPGFSGNGEGSGFACVYENVDSSGWQHFGDDLIGQSWEENLGYAVSMTPDANRIVVGAPNKMLNGVSAGQILIMDIFPSGLVSTGELFGRDGEKFGVSVGVSNNGRFVLGGATMANVVRVYG